MLCIYSDSRLQRFQRWWDPVVFIALVYNVIAIPLRIFFPLPFSGLLFSLDCLADLCILLDICSSARNRKRLSFDIVSMAPLDLIAFVTGLVSAPATLAFLRLPRLLRTIHFPRYFSQWEKRSYHHASFFRLAKLFSLIVLGSYIMACGWFAIGSFEAASGGHSWLTVRNLEHEAVGIQLLQSFYWAVTTVSTVGYGDIIPQTHLEVVYTLIVFLMGVSLWAYVIGNVAALIANLDSTAATFNRKMDAIKQYMQYRRLPLELQHRVINHYEFLWSENKALDEEQIFNDLPSSLRVAVALYLNQDIIKKVPFFQDAEKGFVQSLVTMLRPQIFSPGDMIIQKGEIGREMYFIAKGEVEVVSEDGKEVLHTHGTGDFFGEVALLFSERRTASVKAKTFCDLFVLTAEDLASVLKYYPDFSKRLYQIGRQRHDLASMEAPMDHSVPVSAMTGPEPEGYS